jgi:transposase-like protein
MEDAKLDCPLCSVFMDYTPGDKLSNGRLRQPHYNCPICKSSFFPNLLSVWTRQKLHDKTPQVPVPGVVTFQSQVPRRARKRLNIK